MNMKFQPCLKKFFVEEHPYPIDGHWHLYQRVFLNLYKMVMITDKVEDLENYIKSNIPEFHGEE